METVFLYSAFIIGGSVLGYYYEVVLRMFFKMPNQIKLKGPYHPVYGVGIALSFLVCTLVTNPWLCLLAVSATIIVAEYVGGLICNKILKLNLWDYKHFPYNLHGQICIFHSIGWIAAATIFTFLIFPIIHATITIPVSLLITTSSVLIIFLHFNLALFSNWFDKEKRIR